MKKIKFCTDKSNFKCDYTRNKIRLKLIPQLKEINPFAVDVSSGIETDKKKNPEKMKKFVKTVRDMR